MLSYEGATGPASTEVDILAPKWKMFSYARCTKYSTTFCTFSTCQLTAATISFDERRIMKHCDGHDNYIEHECLDIATADAGITHDRPA